MTDFSQTQASSVLPGVADTLVEKRSFLAYFLSGRYPADGQHGSLDCQFSHRAAGSKGETGLQTRSFLL